MSIDALLDLLVVPRPGGSAALERTAALLEEALRHPGVFVASQGFASTPHGLALVWTAALLLALGYTFAVARRRFGVALGLALLAPLLLLVEFELLLSPVSGLLGEPARNLIARHPGAAGAGTLVFTAHYDSITHAGDHHAFAPWGFRFGPAAALALLLAIAGLRWPERVGRAWAVGLALLSAVPYAVFFGYQAVGPMWVAPSPGALDNAGSVAALVMLSERLRGRPPGEGPEVVIALLAGEEQRALGSRALAGALAPDPPEAIVNLESIGARGPLGYVPEDGTALQRRATPAALVRRVQAAAATLGRPPLAPTRLPSGTLTDARSLLLAGLPAITLRATEDGGFPRGLHTAADARDRISTPAIAQTVELLAALVESPSPR